MKKQKTGPISSKHSLCRLITDICRKALSFFLLSALLLPATPVNAASNTILKISCATVPGGPVIARKRSNTLIADIPGGWDASKLLITIDGTDSFYIDKKPVTPETPFDATQYIGKTVSITNEKNWKIDNLTINQGSKIPAIFITADANQVKDVNSSKNNVITEGSAVITEADGTLSYNGAIEQFKGRGNATFAYNKKPYEFKLEKSTPIGGIGKGKTWILLANYLDNSLLRNQIVLDLSRQIGLPFAVKCVPADLWINGNYNGLYLLTEKIQIKENRVNIFDLEETEEAANDQPLDTYPKFDIENGFLPLMCGYEIPNNPDDITGGYIFVIEKPHRLNEYRYPGFKTDNSLSIRIKEPTCPSQEMVKYLGDLVNHMQKAIMAPDGNDPESGKNYKEYLDVTSFAKKYLIEDLSKNYDAVSGSQYMFKNADRFDPLIYAGPSWDYDMSFGNVATRGSGTNGDYLANVTVGPCNLYKQLSKQSDFLNEVGKRWREDMRPALAILLGEKAEPEGSIIHSITDYRARIEASAAMNFRRWNPSTILSGSAGYNFNDAVNALRNWITRRTKYMDERYAEQSA